MDLLTRIAFRFYPKGFASAASPQAEIWKIVPPGSAVFKSVLGVGGLWGVLEDWRLRGAKRGEG